jgi:hypothetical protein
MQQGASGRRAMAIGAGGTQDDRPGPVGLASFLVPRCPSSLRKPLIHLEVHAPKFIVQKSYDQLRKTCASLPSQKIPNNSLQIVPHFFVHFSTEEKPSGELFVNLCTKAQ